MNDGGLRLAHWSRSGATARLDRRLVLGILLAVVCCVGVRGSWSWLAILHDEAPQRRSQVRRAMNREESHYQGYHAISQAMTLHAIE